MAEQVNVEEVADAMYNMVKGSMGQKKWKATDLTKAVIELFGADKCDKRLAKTAIRELMDSGRCVYTYFGGSFIEIPHKEGAAN
jgi:hypothetical protein